MLLNHSSHHESRAHHAIDEFVEFDATIEASLQKINLDETLVIVTADHRKQNFYKYSALQYLYPIPCSYSHGPCSMGYQILIIPK